VDKRCRDKDGGWVHFRGYWLNAALKTTGVVTDGSNTALIADPITIQIVGGDCANYLNTNILALNNQYAIITNCSAMSPLPPIQPYINVTAYGYEGNSSPTSVDVYNVTGNEYGVDAYWTGVHYEFSGWGWSQEYGWIRFNPLIFIGYAWLESLFGNIYVGENFQLPDAKNLDDETIKKCDMDGDGTKNEYCFVSTYRIEAGGIIKPLVYTTGQSVSSGTSLIPSLTGLNECGFGAALNNDDCDRLLGSPDLTLLRRENSSNSFTFPTVQPSTSTYRNALGKLDVGGLTTSVTTSVEYKNVVGEKTVNVGTNRFGHTLFMAEYKDGLPKDWSVGELFGANFIGLCGGAAICPPLEWVWPLGKLQNQVVHVKGDLTVGYDPNSANKAETTFASLNRGTEELVVASTANFPESGTLIINTGEVKEEYLSYTGKNDASNTFTGIKTVKGDPATVHSNGDSVRWVWRLPFDAAATKPQNLTIVVDGDLKINYNIIASDTTKDLDLLASVLPNIGIKNAHSVAFIVRGDVVIAKEVNYITGAFIVISRNTDVPPDQDITARSTACDLGMPEFFNGCGGLFDTGKDADPAFCNSSETACNPLTIEGLLFARQFNFARSGALETIDVPAERVIFDQRLFLNPPPGLEDLTKALPNPTRQIP
jgi:hypothetical protein